MFFRLQVISYLYGIDSDRQLCEEINVNVAYRWFIGLSLEDEAPNHSSLTRIRDRFGEGIFKKGFESIVQQCQKVGLVKGRRFKIPINEIIADKGYGRGPSYACFRKKGIRTYIPLHKDNIGKGRISRGEFAYDRRNDRYRCPQNHFLYPYEKMEGGIKRYRIIGGHCKTCVFRG